MKLGLNLSFAVKRWIEPERLASLVKHDFATDHVQVTWDLIDPWWPAQQRGEYARRFREAFEREGVVIDSTFSGLAAYSYPQLLAPDELQRGIALQFFKRAVDMTAELGAEVMGTAIGALSYDDARNPQRREFLYQDMLKNIRAIAAHGKEQGLKEIHIEATPLFTEIPHSPSVSVKMMEDLQGTEIPVRLLFDWGHALYRPLLGDEADIALWFRTCGPYIGAIHLQQTDGEWDRHWDFTKEGIVTPELIQKATADAGLDHITQYLEVCTAIEDDDDQVYARMKQTMDYLHRELEV